MRPGQLISIQFPNGMTLDEGVEKAEAWWNEVGRSIVLKAFEQAEKADDSKVSKGDGLLSGLLFEQLNTREQHKVVTTWYDKQGRYL